MVSGIAIEFQYVVIKISDKISGAISVCYVIAGTMMKLYATIVIGKHVGHERGVPSIKYCTHCAPFLAIPLGPGMIGGLGWIHL